MKARAFFFIPFLVVAASLAIPASSALYGTRPLPAPAYPTCTPSVQTVCPNESWSQFFFVSLTYGRFEIVEGFAVVAILLFLLRKKDNLSKAVPSVASILVRQATIPKNARRGRLTPFLRRYDTY